MLSERFNLCANGMRFELHHDRDAERTTAGLDELQIKQAILDILVSVIIARQSPRNHSAQQSSTETLLTEP